MECQLFNNLMLVVLESSRRPSSGLTEAQVRHLIDIALYNYSADQIARFDFALESAGARVVDHSKTYDPLGTMPQIFGFTFPITLARSTPSAVIQVCVCVCW